MRTYFEDVEAYHFAVRKAHELGAIKGPTPAFRPWSDNPHFRDPEVVLLVKALNENYPEIDSSNIDVLRAFHDLLLDRYDVDKDLPFPNFGAALEQMQNELERARCLLNLPPMLPLSNDRQGLLWIFL